MRSTGTCLTLLQKQNKKKFFFLIIKQNLDVFVVLRWGSYYVALAGLEFIKQTRLALNLVIILPLEG